MSERARHTRFDADRKALFLRVLRRTGLVARAAYAAGVSRRTAEYRRDPKHASFDREFSNGWDDALTEFERCQRGSGWDIRAFVDRLYSPDAVAA